MTATIAHFIDGKAVFGTGTRSAEVFNPATGAATGRVALADKSDVETAIASAQAAFPAWAATTPLARARVMFKFKQLLEDHADALAEFDDIHARVVDVHPVDADLAGGDMRAVDQVVHAVEAAQQGALAATGGPDEGGDLPLLDVEGDVVQRARGAVVEIDVVDLDDGAVGGTDRRGGSHGHRAGRDGGSNGFGHGSKGGYHLYFLRSRWRRMTAVMAMAATVNRNTKAVPYWTSRVYSFCGILEATT